MRIFASYIAAALIAAAGASQAQDVDILLACSKSPIGAVPCDAEALADHLGLMSGGDVLDFRESRMESFAILTSLRLAASAIFFNLEDDGCVAEEERSQAVQIWELWVQLPPDATPAAVEKYAVLNGLMRNVYDMEIEC